MRVRERVDGGRRESVYGRERMCELERGGMGGGGVCMEERRMCELERGGMGGGGVCMEERGCVS